MSGQAISYALVLLVVAFALVMVIIGLSIMDRKADVKRLHAMRKEGAEHNAFVIGTAKGVPPPPHAPRPRNPIAMPDPARRGGWR